VKIAMSNSIGSGSYRIDVGRYFVLLLNITYLRYIFSADK